MRLLFLCREVLGAPRHVIKFTVLYNAVQKNHEENLLAFRPLENRVLSMHINFVAKTAERVCSDTISPPKNLPDVFVLHNQFVRVKNLHSLFGY